MFRGGHPITLSTKVKTNHVSYRPIVVYHQQGAMLRRQSGVDRTHKVLTLGAEANVRRRLLVLPPSAHKLALTCR